VPLFLAVGWITVMVLLAWLAMPSVGPWFIAVLIAASALVAAAWRKKNNSWRGRSSSGTNRMLLYSGLYILGMWCVALILAVNTNVWAPPQLLVALLLLCLSLIAAGLVGRWSEKKQ
jgi:hypothetical protein